MPRVSVASNNGLRGGAAIVDREVQRDGAVAASHGCGGVGRRVGRGSVIGAVPDVMVTGCDGFHRKEAFANGEVERCNAVAS